MIILKLQLSQKWSYTMYVSNVWLYSTNLLWLLINLVGWYIIELKFARCDNLTKVTTKQHTIIFTVNIERLNHLIKRNAIHASFTNVCTFCSWIRVFSFYFFLYRKKSCWRHSPICLSLTMFYRLWIFSMNPIIYDYHIQVLIVSIKK